MLTEYLWAKNCQAKKLFIIELCVYYIISYVKTNLFHGDPIFHLINMGSFIYQNLKSKCQLSKSNLVGERLQFLSETNIICKKFVILPINFVIFVIFVLLRERKRKREIFNCGHLINLNSNNHIYYICECYEHSIYIPLSITDILTLK